jgi:predicted ATPase
MTEQVFVAREGELARLNEFLDKALAGHGQVCFVTGEAGAGKTALLTAFARRVQAQHADLLVAIGVCNAQTGIGDPYLPFRWTTWKEGCGNASKRTWTHSVAIYRDVDDRRGEVTSLVQLAIAVQDVGYFSEAWAYYEQGLSLAHQVGDRPLCESKELSG